MRWHTLHGPKSGRKTKTSFSSGNFEHSPSSVSNTAWSVILEQDLHSIVRTLTTSFVERCGDIILSPWLVMSCVQVSRTVAQRSYACSSTKAALSHVTTDKGRSTFLAKIKQTCEWDDLRQGSSGWSAWPETLQGWYPGWGYVMQTLLISPLPLFCWQQNTKSRVRYFEWGDASPNFDGAWWLLRVSTETLLLLEEESNFAITVFIRLNTSDYYSRTVIAIPGLFKLQNPKSKSAQCKS